MASTSRARQVAYRILGDRSEAEDAAAEAFTRALVTWRKVGALAFRDAWVLRVTANVAVDWRRRRRVGVDMDPAVEGKCTGHQTVPVPVGLDDRHQRPVGPGLERGDIVGQGIEVDDDLSSAGGVHRHTVYAGTVQARSRATRMATV